MHEERVCHAECPMQDRTLEREIGGRKGPSIFSTQNFFDYQTCKWKTIVFTTTLRTNRKAYSKPFMHGMRGGGEV